MGHWVLCQSPWLIWIWVLLHVAVQLNLNIFIIVEDAIFSSMYIRCMGSIYTFNSIQLIALPALFVCLVFCFCFFSVNALQHNLKLGMVMILLVFYSSELFWLSWIFCVFMWIVKLPFQFLGRTNQCLFVNSMSTVVTKIANVQINRLTQKPSSSRCCKLALKYGVNRKSRDCHEKCQEYVEKHQVANLLSF